MPNGSQSVPPAGASSFRSLSDGFPGGIDGAISTDTGSLRIVPRMLADTRRNGISNVGSCCAPVR